MKSRYRIRPGRFSQAACFLFLVCVISGRLVAEDSRLFVNTSVSSVSRIELPRPTGRHSVGTVTYHWIDRERQETVTDEPNDLRQVIAQIWYPASPSTDYVPSAYIPQLESMRAGIPVLAGEVPLKIARNLASYTQIRTHSRRAVSFHREQTGKRFPLILFSPGGNMSRHWYTGLMEELASHGYVAAAISHAYSGWDVFPAGGFLKSAAWGMQSDDPEIARRGEENLSDTLAADARFVLDQLASLNEDDPLGRFTGRLDLERVAIIGHSRGGKTAARSASSDPRFKVVAILDNIGPDRETQIGLSQPQLTVRAPWPEARIQRLHLFLKRNTSKTGAFDVIVRGANHFSFSDLPVVDPNNYPSDKNPHHLHRVITQVLRCFLNRYLNGEEGVGFEELAKRLPEIQVTSFSR